MSRRVEKTIGSINAQAYVDVRLLAKIDNALFSMGYDVGRSMSSLVVNALEFLEEVLEQNGKGQEVGDIRTCIDYMKERGYSMAQLEDRRRSRGIRQAFEDESMEEMTPAMAKFGIDMSAPKKRRADVGKADVSTAEIERSFRKFAEEQEEKERNKLPVQDVGEDVVEEFTRVSMSDEPEPLVKGLPDISSLNVVEKDS